MENVTLKPFMMHHAVATALVQLSDVETMLCIEQNKRTLKSLIESARVAGLLALKKTGAFVPHYHSGPIEHAAITFRVSDLQIIIEVAVKAISRTGVELASLHGATVAALTLYQVLRQLDPAVEIGPTTTTILNDEFFFENGLKQNIRCALVVCSNAVSSGRKEDVAGKTIISRLKAHGVSCDAYAIIPDDVAAIQAKAKSYSSAGFNLLIFCGGTGLTPTDVTPQALTPLLRRQIPGIMEAARSYGQDRTPYALFSRGVAGFINDALVLTLPGSVRGAAETMDAVFPYVMHVYAEAQGLNEQLD